MTQGSQPHKSKILVTACGKAQRLQHSFKDDTFFQAIAQHLLITAMPVHMLCPCRTCDEVVPVELSFDLCIPLPEDDDTAASNCGDWRSCRYLELLPLPPGQNPTAKSASSDKITLGISESPDASVTPLGNHVILDEWQGLTPDSPSNHQQSMTDTSFNSYSHLPSGHQGFSFPLTPGYNDLDLFSMHQQLLQTFTTTGCSLPEIGATSGFGTAEGTSHSLSRVESILERLLTPVVSPCSDKSKGAAKCSGESSLHADNRDDVSSLPGHATSVLAPLHAEIGMAIALVNGVTPWISSFPVDTDTMVGKVPSPQPFPDFSGIPGRTSQPSQSDLPFTAAELEHLMALCIAQLAAVGEVHSCLSVEQPLPISASHQESRTNLTGRTAPSLGQTALLPSSDDSTSSILDTETDSAFSCTDYSRPCTGKMEKTFQCEKCYKRYARKGYLDRHMQTH